MKKKERECNVKVKDGGSGVIYPRGVRGFDGMMSLSAGRTGGMYRSRGW